MEWTHLSLEIFRWIILFSTRCVFFSSFLIQHCAHCALCSCGVFLFVFSCAASACIIIAWPEAWSLRGKCNPHFFLPFFAFLYFTSSTIQTMFFQLHMVVYFSFHFARSFTFFPSQCKSNAICRARSEELSEILLHGKISTILSLMPAASCCAAISRISFALRSRSVDDHLNDDANNDDDDMEANRGNFSTVFFLFCYVLIVAFRPWTVNIVRAACVWCCNTFGLGSTALERVRWRGNGAIHDDDARVEMQWPQNKHHVYEMREMCVHTMHLEWELEKKKKEKNGINAICTIVSETKFLLVRLHHLSRLIWKHNNARKILLRKRIFVWLENGLKSDQRAQLTLVSLNWSQWEVTFN